MTTDTKTTDHEVSVQAVDINTTTGEISKRDATVWEIAQIVAGSRDFPSARTPEKAAVRILAGKELGVGPIASVMGIRIDNGRVSMDACLMAGLIERSGRYDFSVVERDDAKCVLQFTRDGQVRGEAVFTADEAKKAGLLKKDVWTNYCRDMLYWRAVSRGARQYCSGIFGSATYVHEELGLPVDQEGRICDDDAAAGHATGSDLCTKEQRRQIRELLAQLGTSEADYCTRTLAVKVLDELSEYEADKAIKGLAKQAAKKSQKDGAATTANKSAEVRPQPEPVTEVQPAATTPKPNELAEAFQQASEPSTEAQHAKILELAEALEMPREALMEALKRREASKLAELDSLAASALIEKMEEMLQPPFASDKPASGTR